MPTAVFEQLLPGLPRPLRRLVGAIEDRAGLSIDATPHGERMACDFGRHRAVIQVPDGGPPRDSASVYHELLHLKRYFVDDIPKLVYCDDAHEFESDADARLPQLFERLDNQIEHLFIVPHELARYRGARRYWAGRLHALLGDPRLSDDGVLVVWTFVHRVLGDDLLADTAQARVDQRGLGEACVRFGRAVDESKEAATLFLFETFSPGTLPRACLEYFARQQEIALASVKRAAG
ncbi:hypothetical protein KZJ38_07160 [Paraburkholderia edwinii]|uniref:IrrE N-terminal-like domain-containing protein n=1 Tax=Paraburkholderia edwinii TaxID=2861782 RepID=A0ABX8UM54_9BURK|nr:hypothetical protein [Paraburkholderia edwinii]QYD70083.1 hypothetical protein KZJ38_07160 [Paraburkholderia edwinii]